MKANQFLGGIYQIAKWNIFVALETETVISLEFPEKDGGLKNRGITN
jgi:hypothetical protein